jgi:hypothetical protein
MTNNNPEQGPVTPPPSHEQQEIYVAIWSKAVDTQMHFNEMAVKSRQFGLGFVAAALGLGIVLLIRREEFSVSVFGWFDLHMTVLIAFASAFALYAVSILDLKVYHKMLRGAVAFGEDFEQNYMKQIFDLQKGMTQAISFFSRHEDAKAVPKDGKYAYDGLQEKLALSKIERFYHFSIWTLVVVGFFLFLFTANFGRTASDSAAKVQSSGGPSSPAPPRVESSGK